MLYLIQVTGCVLTANAVVYFWSTLLFSACYFNGGCFLQLFKSGMLPLSEGVSLRTFLSTALNWYLCCYYPV